MTRVMRRLFNRQVLDELVEDGIIRVIGTRNDRNVYALTEVGQSPHVVLDPPKTMQ
jgi:DNA-binding HxlR family transcriptional regulator